MANTASPEHTPEHHHHHGDGDGGGDGSNSIRNERVESTSSCSSNKRADDLAEQAEQAPSPSSSTMTTTLRKNTARPSSSSKPSRTFDARRLNELLNRRRRNDSPRTTKEEMAYLSPSSSSEEEGSSSSSEQQQPKRRESSSHPLPAAAAWCGRHRTAEGDLPVVDDGDEKGTGRGEGGRDIGVEDDDGGDDDDDFMTCVNAEGEDDDDGGGRGSDGDGLTAAVSHLALHRPSAASLGSGDDDGGGGGAVPKKMTATTTANSQTATAAATAATETPCTKNALGSRTTDDASSIHRSAAANAASPSTSSTHSPSLPAPTAPSALAPATAARGPTESSWTKQRRHRLRLNGDVISAFYDYYDPSIKPQRTATAAAAAAQNNKSSSSSWMKSFDPSAIEAMAALSRHHGGGGGGGGGSGVNDMRSGSPPLSRNEGVDYAKSEYAADAVPDDKGMTTSDGTAGPSPSLDGARRVSLVEAVEKSEDRVAIEDADSTATSSNDVQSTHENHGDGSQCDGTDSMPHGAAAAAHERKNETTQQDDDDATDDDCRATVPISSSPSPSPPSSSSSSDKESSGTTSTGNSSECSSKEQREELNEGQAPGAAMPLSDTAQNHRASVDSLTYSASPAPPLLLTASLEEEEVRALTSPTTTSEKKLSGGAQMEDPKQTMITPDAAAQHSIQNAATPLATNRKRGGDIVSEHPQQPPRSAASASVPRTSADAGNGRSGSRSNTELGFLSTFLSTFDALCGSPADVLSCGRRSSSTNGGLAAVDPRRHTSGSSKRFSDASFDGLRQQHHRDDNDDAVRRPKTTFL